MRNIDKRKPMWLDSRLRRAGFTLVEVTLATGLVAFALVAILGALPVGLRTVQDAQALQVTGSIAQQMQANLQQMSFLPSSTTSGASPQPTVNINNLSGLKLFYTVEGSEIPGMTQLPPSVPPSTASTTTANTAVAYYRAEFAVVDSQAYGSKYGVASASTYNAAPLNNSRTVTITLRYPQQGTATGPRSVALSFVVARQRID